jgi:outer membrane lipoprotein
MKSILTILLCALLTISCSVMSREVRNEAVSTPSFSALIQKADEYRGKTVIVGGYLLNTRNESGQTVITVLQAPLVPGGKPGLRDRSQGRIIITTSQFLDPEIYARDRKITVAGKVIGSSLDEADKAPFPYLKLESRELYLWPKYDQTRYRHRYPYDDPFWDWDDPWYGQHRPYYFHGSGYRRHHHRWHRPRIQNRYPGNPTIRKP